ncbi:MAG: arylsulfatase [Halieaceae bacterium]|nr:arylsulfatase [Halieaceae bacterium]
MDLSVLRGLPLFATGHSVPANSFAILAMLLVLALLQPGASWATECKKRPNVLLILADDLAHTDLGAYGGEIETPNLDRLAQKGVKLTSFYTAPTCSPTRAMLLTGRDPHAVGLGTMAEALHASPFMRKAPGYTGHLDPGVKTLAELFAGAGYMTAMTGKWHLGMRPEHDPSARGFERSFVLLQGGADHFGAYQAEPGQKGRPAASYREDGAPARFPVGKYSSDFYTSRMLEYLNAEERGGRPFFAYLAFTAPHWPMQAPDDVIDKYKGRYSDGPAALHRSRLKAMQTHGIVIEDALTAPSPDAAEWESLDENARAVASRGMEVYAAMVDNLDQNVGRILQALEDRGELDNTIVLFMSDNGAEGQTKQSLAYLIKAMGVPDDARDAFPRLNNNPDTLGRAGSFYTYGPAWAQAGAGAFSRFKSSTYEGGVRAPAIISGPGIAAGLVERQPLSARDVLPTLLELTGVDAGGDTQADDETAGISWADLIGEHADTVNVAQRILAWELFFRRGVRIGDWKAVYASMSPRFRSDPGTGAAGVKWRLYNLADDAGEQHDLADKHPQVLEKLIAAWDRYAAANQVTLRPPSKEPTE